MKKHLLIISLIFCIALQCGIAQVTFQKSISNGTISYAYSVLQTVDSGYVTAGVSEPIGYLSAIYLTKTNPIGNFLWTKSYHTGSHFIAYDVKQTFDGGYIIPGVTDWFTSGGTNFLYLIRTDANGDTLWTKIYNSGFASYRASSVQQTSDSGYIIVGSGNNTTIPPLDSINAFLFKTGPNGEIHWLKAFENKFSNGFGSVQQTTDNGYIMVGNNVTSGNDSADIYLVKTNTAGDTLWTRAYGGAYNDYGNSVRQTNDGGYVITGSTNSFGAGGSDVYLIKTDSSGNLQWSKTFGGAANDNGYSVKQTIDGGYIVSGITYNFGYNGAYLIKTDSQGILEWSKAIVGTNANSVEKTLDDGYIAGGTVTTTSGIGILLVKTDNLGNSGCNEIDPATITTTPATQQSHTSTNIFIPGINYFTGSQPITVSSGGTDSTLCITVGIHETQATASVNIFPNPATHTINIECPQSQNINVTIINLMGEQVMQRINAGTKEEIDIRALPAGMYFARITVDKQMIVKKIIKQ